MTEAIKIVIKSIYIECEGSFTIAIDHGEEKMGVFHRICNEEVAEEQGESLFPSTYCLEETVDGKFHVAVAH